MGIYTLVFFGGTPVGAPLIGWAADRFGPRSGLVGGGLGTVVWTGVAFAVYWLTRDRGAARADDAAATPEQAVAATDSRA
jgi:MFS family permease